MINRAAICLGLGVMFFSSNIMSSDTKKPDDIKQEIRFTEKFRNGFAYGSGLVFIPLVSWLSPLSLLVHPVMNVIIGGSPSVLSLYYSYQCHKGAKAKWVHAKGKKEEWAHGQEFDNKRSMAKIALNCALGLGTYAAIFLL